jgi:hypothetical protein
LAYLDGFYLSVRARGMGSEHRKVKICWFSDLLKPDQQLSSLRP